jgi:hypothetical protein
MDSASFVENLVQARGGQFVSLSRSTACQRIGGGMSAREKICVTCTKKNRVEWTLTAIDARYHLDRFGYEKHVIVEVEKEEKTGEKK